MTKTTPETLKNIKEEVIAEQGVDDNIRILVGMGTCGISAGAKASWKLWKRNWRQKKTWIVQIIPCGCAGMCSMSTLLR